MKTNRTTKNHIIPVALALALGLGLTTGNALAAPANDDFANAIDLTGAGAGQTGSVTTGEQTGTNTVDATVEVGEPVITPANPATKTVWFKWTSPGDGEFTFGTLGSTNAGATEWDSMIGIYTGATVNALTPLGETPKDTVVPESMTVTVTPGTTYYIQLAGYLDQEAANILLTWNYVATVYQADILSFGPGATIGTVVANAADIAWFVPIGSDLATLMPTFTLSVGATCEVDSNPIVSGDLVDFSGGPKDFVVTSQGATIVNTYTVTVYFADPIPVGIYEPFDYNGTALNGASGTTEYGLSGTWSANSETKLSAGRRFGPLVTRGAGIADMAAGQNRFGGARPVSASALADNGLLDDGETLWFSMLAGTDAGGNQSNSRLAVALGAGSFGTGNADFWIQGGTGVGVFISAGKPSAATFPAGSGSQTTGASTATTYSSGTSGLIVGKITWAANPLDPDTIELYQPGTDLALPGSPVSTLTATLDQTTYNTLTFRRGDRVVLDEIRFGASYAAVTETGSHWDLNGSTADSGSATPAGTWNTDPNWNPAPDGTGVTTPWVDGSVAVFAAGTDATGTYSVTVDGTQNVGGIVVEEGGLTLTGGVALQANARTVVNVGAGLTATIATPFTEDKPLRQIGKSEAGTLVLSGDNSGLTGGTKVSGGVTQFESPSAIPGTARNVSINPVGAAAFGSGFGAGNIPTALLDRIEASSTGAIAVDNYLATDFDFAAAGLTAASLGAVANGTYTGTLTPNGTTYRLGGGGGTLTMGNTNAVTGANALVINGSVVLAADNDYTGSTTVPGGSVLRIMGATGTSGISVSQPAGLLEIGDNDALGTGALSLNGGFGASVRVAAVGTVVTTNPVNGNGNFNIEGSDALTLGTLTLNNNVIITNNNTSATTTYTGITAASGSRALTLSGNGNSTVLGAIGGTTITNVTKNGNGTLTLNGVNAYTGTMTVNNAGTLLVVSPGSLPAGATTLNNTSTLAGNGTIGGNVTVTATANIAPGTSVGTLPITGNLTLTAMAGGAGTLKYELGSIANSDKITVGGTLTIGAGTFGFTDFVFTGLAGLENGAYKLITSGAAISGSLNGADLSGPIGPPENGVTGTLQITGNDIELVVSGVVSGSPYATWAGGEPFDGDANDDGVSNGLAFLLGAANPDANALGLLPTVSETGGGLVLTFSMLNSASRGTATLNVEHSSDLGIADDWVSVLVPETTGSVGGVGFTITPDGGSNDVIATIPNTEAVAGKLFGRLSANE